MDEPRDPVILLVTVRRGRHGGLVHRSLIAFDGRRPGRHHHHGDHDMPSIQLALTLTGATGALPSGKTFAGFKFTATTPAETAPTEVVTTETSISVSDPIPGSTYTCSVAPVDQDGNALEPALTATVDVPAAAPAPTPAPPPPATFPSTVGATFAATYQP